MRLVGKSVYFVGAGFTKALERARMPVPLMMDFIRVMTRYARSDDVVLMALIGLEAMECYTEKRPLLQKLASGTDPKQHRSRLLWHIRRRPKESIEDLLLRAETIEASIPTLTAAGLIAAINDPVLRAQYAINRMFRAIGWKLKLASLTRLFAARCTEPKSRHTFVSFNYDLALERALERAGVWSALRGYGVPLRFRAPEDPSNPPGPLLIPLPRPSGHVTVLKPHGSLNWLMPEKARYKLPILATDAAGALRYIGTTLTHAYVQPPNRWPIRVAPFIIPPTSKKRTKVPLLTRVREREEDALATADEVFILGWSIPKTDKDQVALIRRAIARRTKPFTRVVAVNYHAADTYYRRVARLFGVAASRVERFDGGILDFVGRELAAP